ncbi:M14 family zinc carboxypeptidase [Peterkaempfera griseoplana]|uniref:M14 family zinc carboxypeptidase n=1 Tax=Peterkaempfera griseoplana TaxID=66896 RepID=UPI0012FEF5AC|nr:M14 family zinc carboxypeptidase [Peterkaempfera griseoplana]
MATDTGHMAGRAARFLSVPETMAGARALARRHPERCLIRVVGRSRGGRPLVLLTICGDGPPVLVVGGPHPNEPVGWTSTLYLARHLLRGAEPPRTGPAWHILLCLDPDGAALTAGWPAGPPSMARHFEHFHRPAFDDQPEWLSARGDEGRPLPETLALTRLIDETRPALQCSLHGVDLGGAFLELTRAVPGLSDRFARSARQARMPLDVGTYDAYGWASPSPGTYLMPAAGEPGAFAALPDSPGDSTWAYAGRHGGVTAVVEAPMWAADAVADGRPHPRAAAALRAAGQDLLAGTGDLDDLLAQARPHLVERPGQVLASVEFNLKVAAGLADGWVATPGMTVSQVVNLEIASERIPLRIAALLRRLLAGAAGGSRTEPLRARLEREVTERRERFAERFRARWIPVEDQVSHQIRTILAAADCVTGGDRPEPGTA